MDKLVALTLEISLRSAGNITRQKEVVFDVYRDFEAYCISPRLSEAERRRADLPKTIAFTLEDQLVVTKGVVENNLHIIHALVQQLQEKHMITQ